MKPRLILTTVLVALCGMAQVEGAPTNLVNYSIVSAAGDSWSGQFAVASLGGAISDNSGNTISISANGGTPDDFSYFGAGGDGYLDWEGVNGLVMTFQSPSLYAVVSSGEWSAPWTVLLGNSYAITSTNGSDSYLLTTLSDPSTGTSLSGYGGQISFSATSVPEPSTYAMIGAGVLGLLALRRRRA